MKPKTSARIRAAVTFATDKRAAVLQGIQNFQINVKKIPIEDVYKQAIEAHNAIHKGKADFTPLNGSCRKSVLDKISVNYIRHNLTKYHSVVRRFCRNAKREKVLNAVRSKIYKAIAEAYPELADECRKQEMEKHEWNIL